MLDKVGAGHFFNDLAISLLGRFKGGAAKAAIVSSGLQVLSPAQVLPMLLRRERLRFP